MNFTERMVKSAQEHKKIKGTITDRTSLEWLSRIYQDVWEAERGAQADRCYHDIPARRKWHLKRQLRYLRFNERVAIAWVEKWKSQGYKYDNTLTSKALKKFINNSTVTFNTTMPDVVDWANGARNFNGKLLWYKDKQWKESWESNRGCTDLIYSSILKYTPIVSLTLSDQIIKAFNIPTANSQDELDALALMYQMSGQFIS